MTSHLAWAVVAHRIELTRLETVPRPRRTYEPWTPRCPCGRYLYRDGTCGYCDDDHDPGPFAPAEPWAR